MAFVTFEIPGVSRRLGDEEAHSVAGWLYERVRAQSEDAERAYRLALRIEEQLQGAAVGRPTRAIPLSKEDRDVLFRVLEPRAEELVDGGRLKILRDTLNSEAPHRKEWPGGA